MYYLYRRIGFYLVAFWAALTINFVLPRLMPGDPMSYFTAKYRDQMRSNPHFLDSIRAELGAGNTDPMPIQYLHYLNQILHFDFGVSYSQFPTKVVTIIAGTLPWTIFLAGSATVLSFVVGTLLGVVVAWRRGGILDKILPAVTMFTSAFPSFVVALMFLFALAFNNSIFPMSHSYSGSSQPGFNLPFIADVLYHAALPVIVLLTVGIGGWLLGMRNVMINTLSEDYIVMAQAKGLSDKRVMLKYAARNALLPNVTGFALSLGYAVGGIFLVENVFSYPGIGYTLANAATAQDYPLIQALLLLISTCVLMANFLSDLVYARLDPRVRNS